MNLNKNVNNTLVPARTRERSNNRIQDSDPGKLLELVMNLNDECCAHMQIKINNYFMIECEAEMSVLVEVHTERMEASIQTVGTLSLPRKHKIEMVPWFADTLKSGVEHTELLSNTGQDFLNIVTPHLSKHHGKRRVILTSIYAKPFSIIVCVIGPKMLDQKVGSAVKECFLYIWPTLSKTLSLEYERTMKQKCQLLLKVSRRLFTQLASLETLLQNVMEQAKQIVRAEHCCVLLVDLDKMELVETYFQAGTQDACERRVPMNEGILGQVMSTGYTINVKNLSEHSSYNPAIDNPKGINCKSALFFPIRDQTGLIGVGQLINKITDPYFDSMDEEMSLAFSIYCGVCIVHSLVYQKIQEAHIRSVLANELVMYHMKIGDNEITRVTGCTGYHHHPRFNNLTFNLRSLPPRELPCYVVRMFVDLGFVSRYHIKMQKLVRFILYTKKGYRDVSYHNWFHGFNVAQWAHAAITQCKLIQQGYLTELQAFIYVIAGLVHDLDHRGTTNSFQILGNTTLGALYSSEGSVMERHHVAQAMCILNTEGCDILEALPRKDYDRALLLLRDFILASDLTNYFKNAQQYRLIAKDYQKGNRVHNAALMALLMNCADLSDQIKEWSAVKKTAVAILTEFFQQGDVEKKQGNSPDIIMDREKCFIPDIQIQFLNLVCKPIYQLAGTILPKLEECAQIMDSHAQKWEAAIPIFSEVPTSAGLSVLVSPELDNLIEINMQEKERLRKLAEEDNEP